MGGWVKWNYGHCFWVLPFVMVSKREEVRNRKVTAMSEEASRDKWQMRYFEKLWLPSLRDWHWGHSIGQSLFSSSLLSENTECLRTRIMLYKTIEFKTYKENFTSLISQIKARRKTWGLERLGDFCKFSQLIGDRVEIRPLFSWAPNQESTLPPPISSKLCSLFIQKKKNFRWSRRVPIITILLL